MGQIELARAWYRDWRGAARTALKLLNSVGGAAADLAITQERVAGACFNATHYNPKLDPGEIYRAQMAVEKKRLNQLQKAAHVLALSAGREDKALIWAHSFAENDSGVRITRKEHNEPMAQHLVMQNYFSHLEAALKGKLPELDGGPFLHRCTKGNLLFDKPIKSGRRVDVETMLAFELAIYLRMHTAGRAWGSWQAGMRMPAYGEPCFPVVAAFVAATLGGTWDAKQIGDNTRALKAVGLLSEWQGVNST
jgi:hypothetical protein